MGQTINKLQIAAKSRNEFCKAPNGVTSCPLYMHIGSFQRKLQPVPGLYCGERQRWVWRHISKETRCGKLTTSVEWRKKQLHVQVHHIKYSHIVYACRSARNAFTHEAYIYFDVVIRGTYDSSKTPAEMDASIIQQFASIESGLETLMMNGDLDIAGLQIEATSLRTAEYVMECPFGMSPEFTTFSCSTCVF